MPAVHGPNLLPHPEAGTASRDPRPQAFLASRFLLLHAEAERLNVAIGVHGALVQVTGGCPTSSTVPLARLRQPLTQQMAIARLSRRRAERWPPALRFPRRGRLFPDFMHNLHEHWDKRIARFDPASACPGVLLEFASATRMVTGFRHARRPLGAEPGRGREAALRSEAFRNEHPRSCATRSSMPGAGRSS
jgi:hypothetical protein